MAFLNHTLTVTHDPETDTIAASINMRKTEWESITAGVTDEPDIDAPPLSLTDRIKVLVGWTITEWERSDRSDDLYIDEDDSCPF